MAAAADVVSAVLRSFMVQALTPDALRGRVSSIHVLEFARLDMRAAEAGAAEEKAAAAT